MNRAWLAPFAFLYGTAISVRHKMFDWGLLRMREFDIPVICVGNLTVGGTGKTPVSEMLIAHLETKRNVALLSRGYKRRTKGYLEVGIETPFLDVGDEPKQIKLKFPNIVVAVCEKRAEGIDNIRAAHPETDLIILDDGFQHRYVEPWVNIVLMDYTRPIYRDHLMPWGSLRDKTSQLHRAHFVIVTKCPQDMTPLDRRLVRKYLGLFPYQCLFFTHMENERVKAMFPDDGIKSEFTKGDNVIAMSGIGNPKAFRDGLAKRFNVVDELVYPDHHPYRKRDLMAINKVLRDSPEGTVIVATEKDAVKLMKSKKIPEYIRQRLYFQPIKITFNEDSERDFLNKLDYDIRTNPKDRLLHP